MRVLEKTRWSTPTTSLTLIPGALHLWKIHCGTGAADLHGLWPLLSPHEHDKANHLRQEKHRERYVRGHAGLRSLLSLYMEIAPHAIEFTYGHAGKPAVIGGPEFNMTTSADLALVAVCLDQQVGIDCECLQPRSNVLAIARRMFDAAAVQQVEAAPETQRLEVFARAWTALEARVKADGRGLFRPRNLPPMPSLDIAHCIPVPGYIAAIASPDLPPSVEWTTLTPP